MWQSASVFVSSVAHNDESKLKWCYTCLSFRTSQFIRSFISDHIALHREHTTNAILFRNHLLLLVCVLFVNVSMKTLHSLCFSRCDSMVSIAFAPNYCSVVCSTMPFNWNLDKEQRKRKLMPAFLCCCLWFFGFSFGDFCCVWLIVFLCAPFTIKWQRRFWDSSELELCGGIETFPQIIFNQWRSFALSFT